MRRKRFLAAILLGMVLCFVSGTGYGEIYFPPIGALYEGWDEYYYHPLLEEQPFLGLRKDIELLRSQYCLLEAVVNYVMFNPASFLNVKIWYDEIGLEGLWYKFPRGIDTKGKVYLTIIDNRGRFYNKSGVALLDDFKRSLEVIYSFIKEFARDLNNDVVARWFSGQDIPLGYFYQGEYHLWEE